MESPSLSKDIDSSALTESPGHRRGPAAQQQWTAQLCYFPSNEAGKSLLLLLPLIFTFSLSGLQEQLYRSVN